MSGILKREIEFKAKSLLDLILYLGTWNLDNFLNLHSALCSLFHYFLVGDLCTCDCVFEFLFHISHYTLPSSSTMNNHREWGFLRTRTNLLDFRESERILSLVKRVPDNYYFIHVVLLPQPQLPTHFLVMYQRRWFFLNICGIKQFKNQFISYIIMS